MLLGLSVLEDGQIFFFLLQAISSEARQNWPLIVGRTWKLNDQRLFSAQKQMLHALISEVQRKGKEEEESVTKWRHGAGAFGP